MRFAISRVRTTDNGQPHARAVWEEVPSVARNGRPYTIRRWVIEVANLEELLALSREVGSQLILSPADDDIPHDLPGITIYDDYLE